MLPKVGNQRGTAPLLGCDVTKRGGVGVGFPAFDEQTLTVPRASLEKRSLRILPVRTEAPILYRGSVAGIQKFAPSPRLSSRLTEVWSNYIYFDNAECKSSFAQVESLTIRPERPLVVMSMTRPRRSFGLPCKLVDRDAYDWLTDDYMAKVKQAIKGISIPNGSCRAYTIACRKSIASPRNRRERSTTWTWAKCSLGRGLVL